MPDDRLRLVHAKFAVVKFVSDRLFRAVNTRNPGVGQFLWLCEVVKKEPTAVFVVFHYWVLGFRVERVRHTAESDGFCLAHVLVDYFYL